MMRAALVGLGVALVLDALLGDPPNKLHPVAAMGGVIGRLSRSASCVPSRLFARGVGLLVAGALLFAAPWLLLERLADGLPWWLEGLLLGAALKPTFALRRLVEAGQAVRRALERGDLPEARCLVSWHLVSREATSLSAAAVSSAVIESLAENLTDSFVAPLLCYAVGGLPLAWLYRYVNTADAMIGYHTERYEYLGKAAARLDDALNWIPARVAASALVVSAALRGADSASARRVMVGQRRRTASPNAGWTMAAAAGALGVSLEKSGCYRLEGGRALPVPSDVRRATGLVVVGAVLCACVCAGVILVMPRVL